MVKVMKLGDLAKEFGLTLQGDANIEVDGIATLEEAKSTEISFLFNPQYRKHLSTTKAAAVIANQEYAEQCTTNLLISDDPYFSYAKVAAVFEKVKIADSGVHSSVVCGENCTIASTASIGANVVIGDNVIIGENVKIGANTVIQSNVFIGNDTKLWPNVTVYHGVTMGNACEIASGAVIGSDGFGNAFHQGAWHKVPQLGSVVIGNNVSIGANTTIDRGSAKNTILEEGVKLDNQIQIAHNVQIGAHTAIAGCVGIAGSTKIGKYCQIGGGAGLAGHLIICDQVGIAGMSMITKSITEPGQYTSRGMGLQTMADWTRSAVMLRNVKKLFDRVKKLEAKGKRKVAKKSQEINMTSAIDINEIMELIPHRFPFLLVDRVVDYELEKSIVAIKNVTMNEHHFVGHFPGQPVMPGVLMVEALAQAGAVLAFKTMQEKYPEREENILYLTGVDNARFKRIVQPGDQLKLAVELIKTKGPVWKLKAVASVGDELACSCEIMAVLAK